MKIFDWIYLDTTAFSVSEINGLIYKIQNYSKNCDSLVGFPLIFQLFVFKQRLLRLRDIYDSFSRLRDFRGSRGRSEKVKIYFIKVHNSNALEWPLQFFKK